MVAVGAVKVIVVVVYMLHAVPRHSIFKGKLYIIPAFPADACLCSLASWPT